MSRWYKAWEMFILLWAIYSSLFTPMEFGFFRGLPENLFVLDIVGQIAFLVDVVLLFFVAFRDSHTYRTDYKPTHIALRLVLYILQACISSFVIITEETCLFRILFLRYLKSNFFLDLVSCCPWDLIYKVSYICFIALLSSLRKLICLCSIFLFCL